MADSPAFPDAVSWTFRNARSKEQRTYEQTELSLEGDARILGIGRHVLLQLNEGAVPWERLRSMFDEDAQLDWKLLLDVVGLTVEQAPTAVAEVVATLMGIFPTNEDGGRNPDYDGEVRFLRGALNISRVVDVLKVAATQNDYQRLLAPFSGTLTNAARLGMETAADRMGSAPSSPALPEPDSEPPATSSAPTRSAKSRRTVT